MIKVLNVHANFPICTVPLHMFKDVDKKYQQNSAQYIPLLDSMNLQANYSLQWFQSPNCCQHG